MDNIKALKFATTLFHTYENKEYLENHDQKPNKELILINILSNMINTKKLFNKKDMEDVQDCLLHFNISEVERNAIKKIIKKPYSFDYLDRLVRHCDKEMLEEIFCSCADIFLSKKPLKEYEETFLTTLGNHLMLASQKQTKLINYLEKSYAELKKILKNNFSSVTRKAICHDIVLAEFKKLKYPESKKNNLFETKDGVISSVIAIAALHNTKLKIPKYFAVLWTPQILYKAKEEMFYLISNLIQIYKQFEKIIEWNTVNLNNLIESKLKQKKLKSETTGLIINDSQEYALQILAHRLKRQDYKKISKFQRSVKI